MNRFVELTSFCNGARKGLAMLSVISLAACSDGYPTEDVPQIDPAVMTLPQLLDALNELGQDAQPGARWRYTLREGCELDILVRDEERQRHRIALHNVVIETRSVDGTTEVLLVPTGGEAGGAITALETRRWPDTIRARSLFTQLEARCRASAPTPA
jgi:hypothetical protein